MQDSDAGGGAMTAKTYPTCSTKISSAPPTSERPPPTGQMAVLRCAVASLKASSDYAHDVDAQDVADVITVALRAVAAHARHIHWRQPGEGCVGAGQ